MKTVLVLCACALAVATSAAAQMTSGTIAGIVADPSGRPVPRATIRATDALRAVARTTTTDDAGFFRLVLPAGTYDVTAGAAGLQDVTEHGVSVGIGSTSTIELRPGIAAVSQTVEVVGAAPEVQTMSGDLGAVVSRGRIEDLPLNRRDFLQLALLTPGVQSPVEGSELSTRGAVAMHVNGAREEFNNFLLDGVDNNDAYVNRYVVQPSVDSIEAFKVETNSYSAEYGRNAGGQVNVITRRGTNELHGSGFEYFRNESLNATNYFDTDKQPFSRHQLGGVLGGPIVRDKTFFFATIDALREDETQTKLGAVPSVAARSGNLAGLGTIVDPFTGQPFAGGVIPNGRISPTARQVIAMFPLPNRNDASANYRGSPTGTDNDTQADLRLDHQLAAADRLMVRYNYGHIDLFEPYTEGTTATDGYGDTVKDRTWSASAQHEHVFSASTLNSLRFGANGFARDLLPQNSSTNVGALWNVGWLNVPSASFGYPTINVAGYSLVGDATSLPLIRDSRTFQVVDDLSFVRSSHLLKMGGEFRHIALDSKVDLFSRGSLSFTGAFTGSGIGDLLLGLPTFGIQAQVNNPIAMRMDAYAVYAQDDWRVGPRLTLNLGVRYEYQSPPVDEHDNMTTLNFQTMQLTPVGHNGVSRSGISADRNNVAPRLGASWSIDEHSVVRVGYGVFYDSGMLTVNTAQYFNPPNFNLHVFFPVTSLLTLDNPFPTNGGFVPPAVLSVLDPNFANAYMQHWNAAFERHVEGIGTVTVAYTGSKGSNLVRSSNMNQALPGPGDVQARRPFPQYSDILVVQSQGRSRYDALQVAFNRPLARHVSVYGAYTLSKSMDDQSAFLGVPADANYPQDSRHPEAEWGPSAFDVRHRLSLSYVVTLSDRNPMTKDMQIEGMAVAYSGQPFTPVLRFDNSNSGNTGASTAGVDRPNLVGDATLANPTADQWFNTAAFAVPPQYTFGNAGRNGVRGPGFVTFDVGIRKTVPLSNRARISVGAQVFNLFNRTNFDLPQHFVGETATFGKIFSAKAPRQAQLVARFTF